VAPARHSPKEPERVRPQQTQIPLVAGLGAALIAAATVPAVALGHDQGAPTNTPIKHLVVIFEAVPDPVTGEPLKH